MGHTMTRLRRDVAYALGILTGAALVALTLLLHHIL